MTSDRENGKRLSAERALEFVEKGSVIGVGTGSTVRWFIEALGREPDRPPRFDGIENLPRRVRVLPADAAQVQQLIVRECE